MYRDKAMVLLCVFAVVAVFGLCIEHAMCFASDVGQASAPKSILEDGNVSNSPVPSARKSQKQNIKGDKPTASKDVKIESKGNRVVFFDDFRSNVNNWETCNDKSAHLYVDNGYYISHKRNERSWVVFADIGLKSESKFTIETEIIKNDGDLDQGYGLLWGFVVDPREYNSFSICGTGSFKIESRSGRVDTIVVDWTKSTSVS